MTRRSARIATLFLLVAASCAGAVESRQAAFFSLRNGTDAPHRVGREEMRTLRKLLRSRAFLKAVAKEVRRDWRRFFKTDDWEREVRKDLTVRERRGDMVRLAAFGTARARARALCDAALQVMRRWAEKPPVAAPEQAAPPDPAVQAEKEVKDLEAQLGDAKRNTDETVAARKALTQKLALAEEEMRKAQVAPRDPAPVEGPTVDSELQARRDKLSAVEKAIEIMQASLPADHPSRKEAEQKRVEAAAAVKAREDELKIRTKDKAADALKPLEEKVRSTKDAVEAARKAEEDAFSKERELKKAVRDAKARLDAARRTRRPPPPERIEIVSLPWKLKVVKRCGSRYPRPRRDRDRR